MQIETRIQIQSLLYFPLQLQYHLQYTLGQAPPASVPPAQIDESSLARKSPVQAITPWPQPSDPAFLWSGSPVYLQLDQVFDVLTDPPRSLNVRSGGYQYRSILPFDSVTVIGLTFADISSGGNVVQAHGW